MLYLNLLKAMFYDMMEKIIVIFPLLSDPEIQFRMVHPDNFNQRKLHQERYIIEPANATECNLSSKSPPVSKQTQ